MKTCDFKPKVFSCKKTASYWIVTYFGKIRPMCLKHLPMHLHMADNLNTPDMKVFSSYEEALVYNVMNQ